LTDVAPRTRAIGSVPPEIRQAWGQNIADARLEPRYPTQRDLAEALGVTVQAVSAWERGISAPSDMLRVRLARLLHVDIADLFPIDDDGTNAA
jgi:transcriptional regulator with XRE-family HTH domain